MEQGGAGKVSSFWTPAGHHTSPSTQDGAEGSARLHPQAHMPLDAEAPASTLLAATPHPRLREGRAEAPGGASTAAPAPPSEDDAEKAAGPQTPSQGFPGNRGSTWRQGRPKP